MGSSHDFNTRSFPECFPPGCPPKDAQELEIDVHRLCERNPICEGDFKSFYESDPNKYRFNDLCYGLSVYNSHNACIAARRKSPNLRNKTVCAHGITYKSTGKIKQTGKVPNHYTWWLYEEVKPHTYFEICDDGVQ